jgi:hypothetical protein
LKGNHKKAVPERDTAFGICHCGVGLFLEVFVEPVDEVAVPEEAVLRA